MDPNTLIPISKVSANEGLPPRDIDQSVAKEVQRLQHLGGPQHQSVLDKFMLYLGNPKLSHEFTAQPIEDQFREFLRSSIRSGSLTQEDELAGFGVLQQITAAARNVTGAPPQAVQTTRAAAPSPADAIAPAAPEQTAKEAMQELQRKMASGQTGAPMGLGGAIAMGITGLIKGGARVMTTPLRSDAFENWKIERGANRWVDSTTAVERSLGKLEAAASKIGALPADANPAQRSFLMKQLDEAVQGTHNAMRQEARQAMAGIRNGTLSHSEYTQNLDASKDRVLGALKKSLDSDGLKNDAASKDHINEHMEKSAELARRLVEQLRRLFESLFGKKRPAMQAQAA